MFLHYLKKNPTAIPNEYKHINFVSIQSDNDILFSSISGSCGGGCNVFYIHSAKTGL